MPNWGGRVWEAFGDPGGDASLVAIVVASSWAAVCVVISRLSMGTSRGWSCLAGWVRAPALAPSGHHLPCLQHRVVAIPDPAGAQVRLVARCSSGSGLASPPALHSLSPVLGGAVSLGRRGRGTPGMLGMLCREAATNDSV